ncbi:MAG: dTDP-4-dehydrorhamnose reductase [Marinomonas sp.]
MKICVTGADGQLGKALLASPPEGWQVIGLSRKKLDLSDGPAIAAFVAHEAPDVVINAGAYTAVDKAENEPELAMAVNGKAPAIFARSLAEYGGRLVQISTDFVFDGAADTPYAADATRDPLSVYGQTKAAGEDGAGDTAIILRTSWVYAAGGSNFVRTMLRLMAERDELSVVADQIGSPSWAPDIARTVWALVEADKPGIYHHQDAGDVSWHGFATAIAEEAHALGLIKSVPTINAIPSSDYPTPAARPAYSVLDDRRTRALLDDTAQPWRENLRKMLNEEKSLG